MATAVWDQSDFETRQSFNISSFVAGMDFVISGKYVLTAASVWLVDDSGTPVDGELNSFSGSISWGIFSDAGDGPVELLYHGDGAIRTQVAAGHADGDDGDIVRVDFSFDIPFALDAGTYWFALHEGTWGSAFDGSDVYWAISQSFEGQPWWYTQNVSDPTTGWTMRRSEDSAFILWGNKYGAQDDIATTKQDTAVRIYMLDNDGLVGAYAITRSMASHGTVVLNDNGTPLDNSDDYLVYTPGAGFFGTDSFTYDVTMGGVTTTATVTISVNDPPTDITLSSATVAENASGALIGTLTTSDINIGDTHSYAVVDDARFEVVAGQLKLKDGIALDFETEPQVAVTVRSTDAGGLSVDKTFVISVTDVYEAPANSAPIILSPRLQNAVEGDKAAFTVEARDPDGDALTYAISGGRDADAFVIDAATGQLTFRHMPDFEWPGSAAGTNAYLVEVSVSDGRLTTAKTFEIDVADVDEARVIGTFGDDRFSAGDSPTHFIGLSGLDAVTFSGPAADYAIEKGPHGMLYVTGPHGTDTLSSIERLQFDDGTLAFDTGGTAGQMFRLYQAAFGREPDAEGLGYWIRHQDAGRSSFEDVARSFMASPEFIKLYGDDGALSDDAFIGLLYANVLGRDPDPGGFAYWADKLGAGQTSRPDLLAFFSDSNENVAGTADATGDGVWFV